ncbi:MAG: hypothetical protein JWQ81_3453 [Amycolatopsis sp.]|uniref:DUF6519 domain-containing protein n=1 Tax=Amycolatopsis sp. TaxID=37632 RepID=UPI00262CBB71|nr:DUF6519 domain-containing protein [Amycolatopsis sp.]MCU1682714.1 hypothetical protein [Amycolatopsis sp.]
MQADLSRTTFDAAKHFSAVLSQQGRVQLDADANEQAAILLHQLRTAIADLIGPAGAPEDAQGFVIGAVADKGKAPDLTISAGRIYVDGILVENDQDTTYWEQPDGHLDPDSNDRLPNVPYGVYLRVWERLITAVQDPALREIALGDPGPDTAARSKVVWQVAATALETDSGSDPGNTPAKQLDNWLAQFGANRGLLGARALRPDDTDADACHLPPEARFRGPENQLYRVEIHSGGEAWDDRNDNAALKSGDFTCLDGATFKWSRENASVVFPIVSLSGSDVTVATLGRDGKLALEVGDLVEIVDDATACRVADDVPLDTGDSVPATPLRQVVAIDPVDRLVTLDGPVGDDCGPGSRPELNPVLRRWDNRGTATTESAKLKAASDGALPLFENVWIDLEDGVQVRFSIPGHSKATYRGGDYWQIPARTISGDVQWPIADGAPAALPPNGVQYSYAPLALIGTDGTVTPLASTFPRLGKAASAEGTASRAEPAGAESAATASASTLPAAAEASNADASIPTETAIAPVPQPLVPQPFPRTTPAPEGMAGKESSRFRGPQDV